MLNSIGSARESIRLEMYIFRASPIGEAFRDALVDACQRGVSVQVLNDALGSISLPETFWDPLVRAGGKFRWFNPLRLKRFGFRDHRKVLVCDNEVAYVGGYNIGPEYQGDGVTTGWHDLGVRLPASFARELGASFDAMFSLADFKHLRFTRLRRARVKKTTVLSDGQLVVNAPGRGQSLLQNALLEDLKNARRVHLISAYFLPPRQLRRALTLCARAGGDVRLILPGKSDVALSFLAARYLYHGLLRAGIKIYEYEPQILHSKLYLIDDKVYAGSANLDKRSFFINYELLVRLQDAGVLDKAECFFEKTASYSRPIDPQEWSHSRSLWGKLKEQWAYLLLARVDPYITQLQMRLWEAAGPGDTSRKNTISSKS
jgi:cardiolipin synthase